MVAFELTKSQVSVLMTKSVLTNQNESVWRPLVSMGYLEIVPSPPHPRPFMMTAKAKAFIRERLGKN